MARKTLKKAVSKFHIVTKIVIAVFLIAGFLIGYEAVSWISLQDRFVLRGAEQLSLDVGADGGTYLYTEEGVEAVCFGMDVSDTMKVETELEVDEDGRYIIPTDKEGVYTITYTVDCLKFGADAPNGAIKRIRIFTVTAAGGNGNG